MVNSGLTEIIFSLVLSALIMTIFEIVFTYKMVFPGIEKSIDSQLANTFKPKQNRSNIEKIAYGEIDAALTSINEREQKNIKRINMHSKVFLSFLVIILSIIIYICCQKVLYEQKSMNSLKAPTIHTLITVAVLILFTVNFYFMAKGEYQLGSTDLLIPTIVKRLCGNVDTCCTETAEIDASDIYNKKESIRQVFETFESSIYDNLEETKETIENVKEEVKELITIEEPFL
tara:strand:- start:57 stop:749 length:693 start_codon:yes stop_codon:yes gene_type:complete